MCVADYVEFINSTSNPTKFKHQLKGILNYVKNYYDIFDITFVMESAEYFLENKFYSTKENYIKRYGEKLGNILFYEFRTKSINSIEKFKRIHGEKWEEKWEEYKQKSTHTEEKYIAKFGEILGKARWQEYISKTKHTLETFINRHGKIKGTELYNDYILKIVDASPNNKLNRINKRLNLSMCKEELSELLRKNKVGDYVNPDEIEVLQTYFDTYSSKKYPSTNSEFIDYVCERIDFIKIKKSKIKTVLKEKIHSFLIHKFYRNIDEFEQDIIDMFGGLLTVDVVFNNVNSKKYKAYSSYTDDGSFLKSTNEIYFYKLFKDLEYDVISNKRYPNSELYFDFYIPEINTYIELSENYNNDDDYRTLIDYKSKTFNSIVLKDRNEINNFYNKIKIEKQLKYLKEVK